jgi:arabinogalactan oligomer / maltooligosaccharide transport system permease protein
MSINQRPNFFSRLQADIKENPKALKSALLSALLMGLGQFRNKQKTKGLIFLGIFIIFLLIELGTSQYIYAFGELGQFPAIDTPLYFFRDYGGFFTKGLWGLFTLGKLVIGNAYRGGFIVVNSLDYPWLSADNSINLLGNGLLALVVLSFFIMFYIFNIVDAYSSRKFNDKYGKVESFKEYLVRMWDTFFAFIIIAPAMILIAFFTLVPFLFSFSLAFTNYTYRVRLGADFIKWVGLANFGRLITDAGWLSIFSQVFLWTIIWALMSSFTVYILGFVQAMIIQSKYVKFKKFWRLILIIPWALPAMISLMVFKNVFDTQGLANQLLIATNTLKPVSSFLYNIGLQGKLDMPISWMTAVYNGNLAKAIAVFTNLWLGAPYHMMLITGVLNTIPGDLYEAADVDGATGWQRFRYITLPLVLNATLPMLIMTFSFNFNNFGAIYFLTGGGPAWPIDKVPLSMQAFGGIPGQTDILISWIFKLSFSRGSELYNLAAVYSMLIFFIVGGFAVYNLARNKDFWKED